MGIFEAFFLGVVEGLTEFLPISSTGHLILVSHLFGLEQIDEHKSFEIAIQLGSILAVVAIYFKRFLHDFPLLTKLAVAFVPTGVVGLMLYRYIKALFAPQTVVIALFVGGIVLLLIELVYAKKTALDSRTDRDISYKQALIIGCAQCLSMIPGTSRSAATIVGGLLCGLNRRQAIEFSFLLAVPTMLAATGYDLYKNYAIFSSADLLNLAVGFVTAFVVALCAIKGFLRFIARFNFVAFGIYRIAIAAIFFWIVF
ncbi:undecaprenyl-diphosphatase [Campylobacterota bacterium]|nr:undecaprenyl-diphosphatase [Campylobacterota bacterium]